MLEAYEEHWILNAVEKTLVANKLWNVQKIENFLLKSLQYPQKCNLNLLRRSNTYEQIKELSQNKDITNRSGKSTQRDSEEIEQKIKSRVLIIQQIFIQPLFPMINMSPQRSLFNQ